jgi:signal peptidase II
VDNAAAPTGPDQNPAQDRDRDLNGDDAGSGPDDELTGSPAPAAGPRRRRRIGVLLAVAAIAYALDVVSKVIVVAELANRGPVHVLGTFLQFTYTRNPGAAFSFGIGYTVIFSLIAVGVVVAIARVARSLYSLPWAIALGLLLGGALGNLTDRIVRSPGFLRGWVVDFIQFPHFAIFNLADSAISVGGVLMVLLAFRGLHPDGTDERAAQPEPPASESAPEEPSESETEPVTHKLER